VQHAFTFRSRPSDQAIFDLARTSWRGSGSTNQDAVTPDQTDSRRAIRRIAAARRLEPGWTRGARSAVAAPRGPFWGARGGSGHAGQLRTAAARAALIDAIPSVEHPRARRAVVKALGNFRGDQAAAAALIAVIDQGDASYYVEAEACLSLGRTRVESAPAVLRRAAERDSFADVIRQHVYRGLAEARDDSAIEWLAAATEYGRHPSGRRAAMMALAHLTRAQGSRRATCAELLECCGCATAISGSSTRRSGARRARRPGAIGALDRVTQRDLGGRLRRRGREVNPRISGRPRPGRGVAVTARR
jgi:aminopeptidase N